MITSRSVLLSVALLRSNLLKTFEFHLLIAWYAVGSSSTKSVILQNIYTLYRKGFPSLLISDSVTQALLTTVTYLINEIASLPILYRMSIL